MIGEQQVNETESPNWFQAFVFVEDIGISIDLLPVHLDRGSRVVVWLANPWWDPWDCYNITLPEDEQPAVGTWNTWGWKTILSFREWIYYSILYNNLPNLPPKNDETFMDPQKVATKQNKRLCKQEWLVKNATPTLVLRACQSMNFF